MKNLRYLRLLASAAPSERFDDLAVPKYLPPIATSPGGSPALRRPLLRRDRSVLHAAEVSASRGHTSRALAWFFAADIPPPLDWLVNIATAPTSEFVEAREFFGHAICAAAEGENTSALRDIARRAVEIDPQMARLAGEAAEGLLNAVQEVGRLMRTVHIDLSRAGLPSRNDFDAPPVLPAPAAIEEMNRLIWRSRQEAPPAAFDSLAKAACAYPLIYWGADFLDHFPTWAWRCFEAAEHLRDLGVARDV